MIPCLNFNFHYSWHKHQLLKLLVYAFFLVADTILNFQEKNLFVVHLFNNLNEILYNSEKSGSKLSKFMSKTELIAYRHMRYTREI